MRTLYRLRCGQAVVKLFAAHHWENLPEGYGNEDWNAGFHPAGTADLHGVPRAEE